MKKILIVILIVISFVGCSVTYKEYTKIPECDIAIMLGKIKSQKGNNAFEIDRYLDKCYDALKNKKK
jgi:vancomycin permeability regulator SanA